jgi:asparagine synthase (glutamine-hydrolysing)
MSSFVGAALLASGEGALPVSSLFPPDEPGLASRQMYRSVDSAVAHRQRIVTPEDRLERQPWSAWGDRGWICFAGRLDGRTALANALGIDRIDDVADGILACRAVERWGENAPGHLLGDFALAAWHEDRRKLILAGDAGGMRTVYYWRNAGLVLFSTTLRGLLSMPQVSRAIDEQYVGDFLAMNFGDDDATFYRDIRKVVPGTCTVMTADRIEIVECHRFDATRRIRLKTDGAYVEAARELLDQAVADRMRSVAPVPISASGGLDSACLAVAALAGGKPVTLLTAVPDPGLPTVRARGGYLEERPLVEALVNAFPGLTAEFHAPPPGADWAPDSPISFAAGAVPHRNPGQVAWFDGVQRRAMALEARSILTGGLGNYTLSWDGMRGLASALCRGDLIRVARELALGSGGRPRRLASMVKRHLVLPLLGGRFNPEELEEYSALSREAQQALRLHERMRQRGNDTGFVFSRDSRLLRINSLKRARSRRPDIRNAMRGVYGLDSSMPLGDLRLIEFCLAIPEEQFLRNGTSRYLARRLLRAANVPAAITENKLRGRQHPEWFAHLSQARSSLPAQMERLRRSPTVHRLIDLDRLDHLIGNWPADTATAERQMAGFRALLHGALSVGAFIAWAEGTN